MCHYMYCAYLFRVCVCVCVLLLLFYSTVVIDLVFMFYSVLQIRDWYRNNPSCATNLFTLFDYSQSRIGFVFISISIASQT